jgi:hypothetical protein
VLVRTIVAFLVMMPLVLHVEPGHAFADPVRILGGPVHARCYVFGSRLQATVHAAVLRAREAGSRERQCAVYRREALPAAENAVRLMEQESACRAVWEPWVIDLARTDIARARRIYEKYCNIRPAPDRDTRASNRRRD